MSERMSEPSALVQTLLGWLSPRLDGPGRAWLDERVAELQQGGDERKLVLAFGLAPRRLGKADLVLEPLELERAAAVRPGWDARQWSIDQAARLALVLASYSGDGETFTARLERIFATADLGELVCLYRGLPLYPEPRRHLTRAREGARTNMRAIFEAVAQANPYPSETFDENAWNHMVLKALFVGSRLAPIVGLDARANPELAIMLRDYAHERQAAGRPVSPELWRCVGRFADGILLADLERVLGRGGPTERLAAGLALADCPRAEAQAILKSRAPEIAAGVRAGTLSWQNLG